MSDIFIEKKHFKYQRVHIDVNSVSFLIDKKMESVVIRAIDKYIVKEYYVDEPSGQIFSDTLSQDTCHFHKLDGFDIIYMNGGEYRFNKRHSPLFWRMKVDKIRISKSVFNKPNVFEIVVFCKSSERKPLDKSDIREIKIDSIIEKDL